MNELETDSTAQSNRVINLSLRLLALGLVLVFCFQIIEPFITLVLWGVILAVTVYPVHRRLSKKLKDSPVWASVMIVLFMLLLIIVPGVWFLWASVGEVKELANQYREGLLVVPHPSEAVKTWPVIGNKIFDLWTKASTDIAKLISENQDAVKTFAITFFGLLASTGKGLFLLAGSIIISGVFLAYAESSSNAAHKFFVRLAGTRGEAMTSLSGITIRNVAKGVLGVSFIQSTLAGIGFIAAGIPAAGLWILVCLMLAIVQIGIVPVSIGTIIYIWSAGSTLTAILFTVWMLLVGLSDNILKPLMMGKGAPVPMLVIFIGTIGGFIHSGFIGLFTGAIVLSLGYKLFDGWLNDTPAT